MAGASGLTEFSPVEVLPSANQTWQWIYIFHHRWCSWIFPCFPVKHPLKRHYPRLCLVRQEPGFQRGSSCASQGFPVLNATLMKAGYHPCTTYGFNLWDTVRYRDTMWYTHYTHYTILYHRLPQLLATCAGAKDTLKYIEYMIWIKPHEACVCGVGVWILSDNDGITLLMTFLEKSAMYLCHYMPWHMWCHDCAQCLAVSLEVKSGVSGHRSRASSARVWNQPALVGMSTHHSHLTRRPFGRRRSVCSDL